MVDAPDVRAIAEQIKTRIGHIEQELKQRRALSDELDRLRGALGRLEGDISARVRGRRSTANGSVRKPRATADTKTTAAKSTRTAAKATPAAKAPASGAKPRRAASPAPRGQTRAKVLASLEDGPKTAGEVAAKTGVARGSASTTLTKLVKSGQVVKAERGYKLSK